MTIDQFPSAVMGLENVTCTITLGLKKAQSANKTNIFHAVDIMLNPSTECNSPSSQGDTYIQQQASVTLVCIQFLQCTNLQFSYLAFNTILIHGDSYTGISITSSKIKKQENSWHFEIHKQKQKQEEINQNGNWCQFVRWWRHRTYPFVQMVRKTIADLVFLFGMTFTIACTWIQ